MSELSAFLNGTQKQLDDFIKNYDSIQKLSCNYYQRLQSVEGGSITRGKTTIYHSIDLDAEKVKRFDATIKDRLGSELFDKYLSRYVVE